MNRPRVSLDSKNITGKKIIKLREKNNLSQRDLAVALQNKGLNVDKNVITRIETGKRFVTDFEVKIICNYFNVPYEFLLDEDN